MRGNSGGGPGGQRSRRGSQVSVNSAEGGIEVSRGQNQNHGKGQRSHPPPPRQQSTDTSNSEGQGSRPISSAVNKAKLRQDSVASNSHV